VRNRYCETGVAQHDLGRGKDMPRQAVARSSRRFLRHSRGSISDHVKERAMTKVLNEVLAANEAYARNSAKRENFRCHPLAASRF
jgi:hypothetical protein